jgi:hypothetical protein
LVCDKCGNQEEIDSAILRSAEELKLLFPNRKITTRTIQEWCVVISSKKIIRRVLLENYKGIGFGKGFYFE